jgi:integrase
MSTATQQYSRYQEGSIARVKRANGPDVWVFRWRELQPDGTRVQRNKVIGDVNRLKTKSDAKKTADNLRAEVNAQQERVGRMTVNEAWGHFQANELRNPIVNRSPSTIQGYLDYFKTHVIPKWGEVLLEEVETVAVERWLHSLPLAPASRTKIRNLMSALWSHAIREKLYAPEFQGTKGNGKRQVFNPISMVRTSSQPVRETETLDLDELRAIVDRLKSPVVRVMVLTACASALRKSELRGLRWRDLDFANLRFNLKQGLVRKEETGLKTRASRKALPMMPELAEVLKEWRKETPYPADDNWVFASPFTKGERPYWAESAMKDYVRPAAEAAGIKKRLHWHVFRDSTGTILKDNGEDVKTIQELLRHANPRITQEVYLHGNDKTKQAALSGMSGLFVVPPAKTA